MVVVVSFCRMSIPLKSLGGRCAFRQVKAFAIFSSSSSLDAGRAENMSSVQSAIAAGMLLSKSSDGSNMLCLTLKMLLINQGTNV